MTRIQKERVCATVILIALTLFASFAVGMGWIDVPSFYRDGYGAAENAKSFSLTVLALDSADCTVLRCGDTTVLVDGGNHADAGSVAGYLKAQKIEIIDLVIATHPHADHIGGLDDVLEDDDFTIKNIVYPYVPDSMRPTPPPAGIFTSRREIAARPW